MMAWLRDRPIRAKLMATALLTCGVALLVALVSCFALQLYFARRAAQRDLQAVSEIVAANAAGPLAFKDAEAARAMLGALSARPEILEARVTDSAGNELVRFSAPERASQGPEIFKLRVTQPVAHASESLGQLELTAQIYDALRGFALLTLGGFLVVFVMAMTIAYAIAARLQHSFTDPLLALSTIVRDVARRSDYTVRARKTGADEIGDLTDAFNHMLEEVQERDGALRDAQRQLSRQVQALQDEVAVRQRAEAELERTHRDLVVASRLAGQAEVATSVLHNVGNVLNSVIVSSTLTSESLRSSKLGNITLAANLLDQHRGQLGPFFKDHPKGTLFIDYLFQLGKHLEEERNEAVRELDLVRTNIEHIKEIVSTQQNYAKVAGVRENTRLVEVVEHALALNSDSMTRHAIEVVKHYEEIPAFSMDKHRVLQILVNLVRNAKDAMKVGTVPAARRLQLTIGKAETARARVEVADNGVGIPAENLTRIFQHGFTTRRDGHGFGLHSGALAAQQMGGRLSVRSEGPGCGAVFTLELPMGADR